MFQTVPIFIRTDIFVEINKIFSKFIWGNNRPRIKLKLLQEEKVKAGFGLPDMMLYYRASVLLRIKDWIAKQKNIDVGGL